MALTPRDATTVVAKLSVCVERGEDLLGTRGDMTTPDPARWVAWRNTSHTYLLAAGEIAKDHVNRFNGQITRVSFEHVELGLRILREARTIAEQIAAHTPGLAAARTPTPSDADFMRIAFELSRNCLDEKNDKPSPKVGAVVVRDGTLLAKAWRGEPPHGSGDHGEFIALEGKLRDEVLQGATVFTTLEPCTSRSHDKHPCAGHLALRKVRRVVIGMLDPNPAICGKGVRFLEEAGIDAVLVDDQEIRKQINELNRYFIRDQEKRAEASKVEDVGVRGASDFNPFGGDNDDDVEIEGSGAAEGDTTESSGDAPEGLGDVVKVTVGIKDTNDG